MEELKISYHSGIILKSFLPKICNQGYVESYHFFEQFIFFLRSIFYTFVHSSIIFFSFIIFLSYAHGN